MKSFACDTETTGLNPMTDRILCITLLDLQNNNIVSFYGDDEGKILEQFFNAIKSCDELITFNGGRFDFPFIIKRALITNTRACDNFLKFKSIDVRKIANGFKYNYDSLVHGKLRDWADIFLITIDTENGAMMPIYYEKKDWKSICEHCSEDCKVTKVLYERCKSCNLL
jgi:predicted PolB exonuclease-like 3'-5' exonuclease